MALQAGVMNLPGVGIPLAESAYTPSKVLCLTEVPDSLFLVHGFIFCFAAITTITTCYLKNGENERK
jgi:hypothetical protein